jgi:putative hydrolase of the HAD superfamily
MRYKNIIFDFGNVLAEFNEHKIIESYCPSPEDFSLMKQAIFYNWDELDRGTIEYTLYMEQAISRLPERLRASAYQLSLEWWGRLTPLENTWTLIRELKSSGYSLYILSNASTYFAEHTDYYEITKEFDGSVYSGNLKLLKPEPGIYNYLFDTYHLSPKDCFFIDDKAENIKAGRQLGMDGIIFTGDTDAVRQALGL